MDKMAGEGLLESCMHSSSVLPKKDQQFARHILPNDEQILRKLVADVNFDEGLRLYDLKEKIEALGRRLDALEDHEAGDAGRINQQRQKLEKQVKKLDQNFFVNLTARLITCAGGNPYVGHHFIVRRLFLIFLIFCFSVGQMQFTNYGDPGQQLLNAKEVRTSLNSSRRVFGDLILGKTSFDGAFIAAEALEAAKKFQPSVFANVSLLEFLKRLADPATSRKIVDPEVLKAIKSYRNAVKKFSETPTVRSIFLFRVFDPFCAEVPGGEGDVRAQGTRRPVHGQVEAVLVQGSRAAGQEGEQDVSRQPRRDYCVLPRSSPKREQDGARDHRCFTGGDVPAGTGTRSHPAVQEEQVRQHRQGVRQTVRDEPSEPTGDAGSAVPHHDVPHQLPDRREDQGSVEAARFRLHRVRLSRCVSHLLFLLDLSLFSSRKRGKLDSFLSRSKTDRKNLGETKAYSALLPRSSSHRSIELHVVGSSRD